MHENYSTSNPIGLELAHKAQLYPKMRRIIGWHYKMTIQFLKNYRGFLVLLMVQKYGVDADKLLVQL